MAQRQPERQSGGRCGGGQENTGCGHLGLWRCLNENDYYYLNCVFHLGTSIPAFCFSILRCNVPTARLHIIDGAEAGGANRRGDDGTMGPATGAVAPARFREQPPRRLETP